VSLVVLTDDRPSWRPSAYRSERWGFSLILRFPVVKVLDFRERKSALTRVATAGEFESLLDKS